MKRALVIAALAIVATLTVYAIASAHAELDHCTPAVSSTVGSPPAQIVCVYTETIDTKRSTMSVWAADGSEVDKKDAHVDLNDPDHKTLVVSLDTSLMPNGLYTVNWRAVTPDDNGLSYGSWQFIVGSANATPYSPTQVLDGEVNAQGTVVATAEPATATVAPANPTAAATTAETAAPAASPTAQATAAAPGTLPTTGGTTSSGWLLLALFAGAILFLGGTVFGLKR